MDKLTIRKENKTIEVTQRLYDMIYKGHGYEIVTVDQPEEQLEDYTVAELQEKAETLELEDYKGLKKAELIELILENQ